MTVPRPDRRRRRATDRRLLSDRRTGTDRRVGGDTVLRRDVDRRRAGERRAPVDRREGNHPSVDQILAAIDLLHAVNPVQLSEEDRRLLDAGLLRLRVALDRLTDR